MSAGIARTWMTWFAAVAHMGLLNASVRAAEAEVVGHAGNLTFENDLFFGSDRYYTNGVQVEVKRLWKNSPAFAGESLRAACLFLGCQDQTLVISRYKIGQLMYTPERISVYEPQPEDRPWAGMLYFTHDDNLLNNDGTVLTSVSWQLGVVGPNSYAAQTQKWIHKEFSGAPPRGWDNQIGGELGLMAMVERRTALSALSYAPSQGTQARMAGHWRIAVGNIMTYVGLGLTMTVGKNLPPVSERGPGIDDKMIHSITGIDEPSAATPPSTSCLVEWLRCTVSASVEARLMARNIFLDGPMFRDGPSVNSRPLVADATVTARLDFPKTRSAYAGPWFVQFRATRRSAEFRSTRLAHSQSFGALTIGTEF